MASFSKIKAIWSRAEPIGRASTTTVPVQPCWSIVQSVLRASGALDEVREMPVKKPPRPLGDHIELSGDAEAAVMRALSIEPGMRFDSCGDFAGAFASGLGSSTSKPGSPRC